MYAHRIPSALTLAVVFVLASAVAVSAQANAKLGSGEAKKAARKALQAKLRTGATITALTCTRQSRLVANCEAAGAYAPEAADDADLEGIDDVATTPATYGATIAVTKRCKKKGGCKLKTTVTVTPTIPSGGAGGTDDDLPEGGPSLGDSPDGNP